MPAYTHHGPCQGRACLPGFMHVTRSVLLFLLGVIMTMTSVLTAAGVERAPEELVRSQTIYQNQLQIIRIESARKQESADRMYIADLNKREAVYRENGELQGVLAIRGERNRISPQPDTKIASVTPLPDDVAKLRKEYEERCGTIAVDEATAVQALIERYIGHLDDIKRELTRQDRVEDALAVNAEIMVVRISSELKSAKATLSLPAETPEERASSPAGDLATRLAGIRIAEFRFTSFNPVTPINELIGYLHHNGIGLRIELGALPVSAFIDHEGRPRYNIHYQSSYRRPEMRREVKLTRTTALAGLQSICDVFGLGYRLDTDAVVIVAADDSRADWARQSMTADAVATMFVDDNAKAVEYFRDKQVRLTGVLGGMTRSVTGGTVAILYAPRPIRIEFAPELDRTQVSGLQEAFRGVQEQAARMGRRPDTPRPVRRLGEDPAAVPSPTSGPRITISVLAEYQTQMGLTVQFVRGSDLAWQRQY